MKAWKIIVAGIVFAIIAQIIHTIEAFYTMDFYKDPTYYTVWSKLMMSTEGPPTTDFYIYSIVFGVIAGIIYAIVYEMIKKSVPGKTIAKQGLYFGFLLFLLGIPMPLTMYLIFNAPTMLLVYWVVSALIIDLIGGVVIARILK